MKPNVDNEVIDEMRAMVRRGASAIETAKFLIERLGLTKDAGITPIIYFKVAFDLRIQDAKAIGAWNYFSGGSWSDEMIETEFSPLIKNFLDNLV